MKKNLSGCQVFTPKSTIEYMLRKILPNVDFLNAKFCENSFGSGNILVVIIDKILNLCEEKELSIEEAKNILENSIYGYEIDPIVYANTLNRLDKYVFKKNITNVKWSLYNSDSLFSASDCNYDVIIGNPPYIRYREVEKTYRQSLREKYDFFKYGNPDIYYCFLEWSINHLSDSGHLVYLIPTTFLINKSAIKIRKRILSNLYSIDIYDKKVIFKDHSTTSLILHYNKQNKSDNVKIYVDQKQKYNISKEAILGLDKWVFDLNQINNNTKIADHFYVLNAVATLKNKYYIFQVDNTEEKIQTKFGCIEDALVKNGASLSRINKGLIDKIIFPYEFVGNELVKFEVEDFETRFPIASMYFKSISGDLNNEARDKKAKYYEYGRSQAIKHLNNRKLLIKNMDRCFTDSVILDGTYIPYSGIFFVEKTGEYTLEFLQNILQSDSFKDYVSKISRKVSNNYFEYSTKDLKEYRWGN